MVAVEPEDIDGVLLVQGVGDFNRVCAVFRETFDLAEIRFKDLFRSVGTIGERVAPGDEGAVEVDFAVKRQVRIDDCAHLFGCLNKSSDFQIGQIEVAPEDRHGFGRRIGVVIVN